MTLTQADVASRPHRTVSIMMEGKAFRFDGVPLSDLLQLVGAPRAWTSGAGVFRPVVEGDQRGARMARMVTDIRVLQLPDCSVR